MLRRRLQIFVLCMVVSATAVALTPPGDGILEAPEEVELQPPPKGGIRRYPGPVAPEEKKTRILSVAEAVPKDAIFFVCLPDARRTLSGLRGLEAVRILKERDIAGRWQAIVKQARRGSKGGGLVWRFMRATGAEPLGALELFGEEMCLALVRNEGPQVVFVADVGDRKADVYDLVLSIIQNLRDYESDSRAHRGVELSAVIEEGSYYSYAFLDNLFIAATGRGTIEKAIDAATDSAESVLARGLHSRSRRLAGEADAYYFAEITGLLESVRSLLSGELSGAIEASTDAGATNAYGYFQIESRGVKDVIRLEGKGTAPPLPPALLQKLTEQSLVAYVPLEANLYLSAQVDFAGLIKTFSARGNFFREYLLKIGPKVAGRLAELAKGLGGELAVARFTPLGRAEPETVVIAGLLDRRAASSALKAMQDAAGGRFSKEKLGDVQVVWAQRGALLNLGPVKFTTYAVSPDAVLLGTSASAVKKCLRQSQFKASNVRAHEDFQRAMENLSPDGSLLAYLDPRGVVDYEYAKKLKELRKTRRGTMRLPPPDSFKDHLFGVGLTGAAKGTEFVVESFGPLGAVSGATAWYLLRLPELREGVDTTRSEQLQRLMKICASLYLYAGDFERFPVSLAELYPNYIELKAFGRGVEEIDEIDSRGEFVYVPGRRLDDLGDEIIVYSKPASPKERRRAVLFIGGHVDILPEDVFQAMIRGER